MPLDGDILGLAIKSAIDGVGDKTDRDSLFKAMGAAIVAHIQENGLVTVTTACPAGAGSGTGTVG